MTADIELGLIGILSGQGSLAGLIIHPGTSADPIPNGQPLLIAEVTNVTRVARGLWKANCPLRLTTPAAGSDLSVHRARGTAIVELFDQYGPGPSSSLAADFNGAQSSWSYSGLAGITVREQVDHERHVIDIEVEIGIMPVES
jgi:hypothetical protein